MKRFNKIVIIGVGLIGGSIGMAVKRKRIAKKVVGLCRRRVSMLRAQRLGAVDYATMDFKKALIGADLVIIATPPSCVAKFAKETSNLLKKGAIITDVASTKAQIAGSIERFLPKDILYVGTHPMAGSEKSGIYAADPELFEGSICILTETARTDESALRRVKEFWQRLGADVCILSPKTHDRITAQVSHLPHILAATLINSVDKKSLKFAASSFKDTTRIAASDPGMWKDISLSNSKEILKTIDEFMQSLSKIRQAIRLKDAQQISSIFKRAKDLRDSLNKICKIGKER